MKSVFINIYIEREHEVYSYLRILQNTQKTHKNKFSHPHDLLIFAVSD